MTNKTTRLRLTGTHTLDLTGVDQAFIDTLLGLLAEEHEGEEAPAFAPSEECITSGPVSDGFSVETQHFACHTHVITGIPPFGEREITYEHFTETEVCPGGRKSTRRWKQRVSSRVTLPCPG